MDKKLNKQYETIAFNLYSLISNKYNTTKGEFSSASLNRIAYHLCHRVKQISYDESNKLLNIARTLDQMNHGYAVSNEEIDELETLFIDFRDSDKNKLRKKSELEILFSKLSMKSRDAIINENEFDDFKEYMHIKRPIESEFEDVLKHHFPNNKKAVLFIVGNVGDGKSHILSYMMKKHSKIFLDYNIKIHNDATETDSPKSTAIETMKKKLRPFTNEKINNDEEDRLIVAINLGVLTNLISELKKIEEFSQIVEFLEDSQVLSSRKISEEVDSLFKVITFAEQRNFELVEGEIESTFYDEVMSKIYAPNMDNPFYIAYQNDISNGMNKILHKNYEFMLKKEFQKSIIYLLIRAEIEYKLIISTRTLFNFFFDISMPRDDRSSYDSYLPYLLFQSEKRSELLTIISTLDPIKNQTREIDELSIELYHAPDTLIKILELLGEESKEYYLIFQSFKDKQESFDNFINTYLRIKFLANHKDEIFDNSLFNKYLKLYSYAQNNKQVEELFELVNDSFSKWNGDSGLEGFIIKNPGKGQIKILVEIDLNPKDQFLLGFGIGLRFEVNNEIFEVIIDYRTFEILIKLKNGYFLKEEDKQTAIQFDLFVTSIINSAKVMNKNIILNTELQKKYELKKFMNKITLSKGNV